MEEVKTAGLILSATNLNDNDKLYTIQTRKTGKITAVSKGIRSHKHKDFAALQPFCYSDMVLSKRGGLYYISQATVNNNFFGIRNSVEQMSYAAYFTDVIKNFPDELPLEDDYFSFVLNTLYLTGKAQEKCQNGDIVEYLTRLKIIFEFKTFSFAGFMPALDGCGMCSSSKDVEYFDTSSGTVICKNCHDRSSGDLVKVSSTILKLLAFLEEADYKTVFSFNTTSYNLEVISHITETYMINSMEIYPKSLTYLKNVISGNK